MPQPIHDDGGDSPPQKVLKFKDSREAAHIYFLPNLFTAGNLFFGFVSMIRCIQARYQAADEIVSRALYTQAVECILLAAFCDTLDGRIARLGGKESLFGMEFDSIADTVSFGVAPALMVFCLIVSPSSSPQHYEELFRQTGWFIGFIYLLCVAVRLARFNVLTSPLLPGVSSSVSTKDFMGLPSPAAAGFVASLVLVLLNYHYDLHKFAFFLPPMLLLVSLLMVSNIPYPSFKQINWQTRTRARTFIFLIILLGLAYLLKEVSFAILFLCYIFYGLFRDVRRTWLKRHGKPLPPEETEAGDDEEEAF